MWPLILGFLPWFFGARSYVRTDNVMNGRADTDICSALSASNEIRAWLLGGEMSGLRDYGCVAL